MPPHEIEVKRLKSLLTKAWRTNMKKRDGQIEKQMFILQPHHLHGHNGRFQARAIRANAMALASPIPELGNIVFLAEI